MNEIAKNLTNPAAFKKVTLAEVKEQYPRAIVESKDDQYILGTSGALRRPLVPADPSTDIELVIPKNLLYVAGTKDPWWPFTAVSSITKPYGTRLTERIAYSIFEDELYKHSYGIAPGFYRWLDGKFRFTVELNPLSGDAEAVMLFTDAPLEGCAGRKDLITFRIERANLNCLLLPLNFLIEPHQALAGWEMKSLKEEMANNLAIYISRYAG